MKSYWMWHYGDYEIFHMLKAHLRREERGYHRPPFWKLSTPYATVKFIKHVSTTGGYLTCRINGSGYVSVDGKGYAADTRITLAPGEHTVEVHVSNFGGLPAVFVDSDVCPGDGSWLCNHFAPSSAPVGWNAHFDRIDQNPEEFPFAYERRLPVTVKQAANGTVYDFGTEVFGCVCIDRADAAQCMGVYYGESEEEALDADAACLREQVCGHATYRLRPRAFRYVFITPAVEELDVTADYEYLPLTPQGIFRCSDPLFNEICATSAYTFHLNCREGFFDGIKRDRWVWAGDAYQSARINRYLFFDRDIEQRTLLGLIGKEPIEQHINTILDYSLLWIAALHEHYMTYADKAFLSRIFPMAQKLLAFCETRLNEDGFIEGTAADWTFIDWSPMEKVGAVCAEQMLMIRAYTAMAALADVLGADGETLRQKGRELTRRVNAFYWNEEKGAFVDSYRSGNAHVTRHANIFAVMYDIATAEQQQRILNDVLHNEAITKITTPYFEGYELDALAKLGDRSAVERMLRSYWGGMIQLGAKTVWEEYDPTMRGAEHYAMYGHKYDKSLCHAWGAGPLYLFGRYYLGVYATAPGYEAFCVEPHPGGLDSIEGTVPINGGTVTVKLDRTTLSVTAERAGGTLIWQGNTYTLQPREPLVLRYG